MTELDFDQLGDIAEKIVTVWDSLTPEQKVEVQNRVSTSLEEAGAEEAGTETQSEFQRRGKAFSTAGVILGLAGSLLVLGVATAPVGATLIAIAPAFLLFGRLGESISIDRAKDIGAWLAAKHPKAYSVFCNNPQLLYGNVYFLNVEGPWYMMDSCSIDTDLLMVDPSGLMSPAEIAAGGVGASMPEYPSWAESNSSSSSSSSSSNLLTLGLVAGAAYLVFK